MRSRILVLVAALALAGCSASTASPSPWTITAAATPSFVASASASPGASASASPGPSASPSSAPGAAVSFTLMDFNIEYGGLQIDFGKIVEAIKAANPDVVAIEEAQGNTRKLATEAGYPYANVRNQIISKYPIIDPPGADGRSVYIELSPGAVIALSNVHLPSDPYGPDDVVAGKSAAEVLKLEQDTRMPAIQERLDVLPGLVKAGIPTFLTGDFNSPSHLDWTAATVGLRPQLKYPLAWPVSTAIEAAGFRDTYRELHPDPVADPGLTWWAGRPLVDDYPDHASPQDRIDIIYAAGVATPTKATIIGEKDGPQVDIAVDPWGTDHRSVMTAFTVQPGDAAPYVAVDQRLVSVGDPVRVRYHGANAGFAYLPITRIEADGTRTTLPYAAIIPTADGVQAVSSQTLEPGDYEVSLMDGATVASTTPFSVARVGAKPTLTLDAATYKAGQPVTVIWRDAPGARRDWIGIYARGADPLVDSYLYYVYTDQGVHGTVKIDEHGFAGDLGWPLPPGEYDAHYLLDDGYTSLAVVPFAVTK